MINYLLQQTEQKKFLKIKRLKDVFKSTFGTLCVGGGGKGEEVKFQKMGRQCGI